MIFKDSPIFDYVHPIIMREIFSFHKCVWKRSAHFINSFWDTADFRDPGHKRSHQFLTTTTQKLSKNLWAFLNFYQHTKNQFIPFIASWDTGNFRVLRPEWPHPFLTTPTPNYFQSTFNFHESVSTCKKFKLFHCFFIILF